MPTMLRPPKATAGPRIPALARMDGVDILHRTRSGPLDVLLVPAGPLATAAPLEDQGLSVTVADPRLGLPTAFVPQGPRARCSPGPVSTDRASRPPFSPPTPTSGQAALRKRLTTAPPDGT
ncbi:hypothetical protein ACFRI7_06300 [Streptomyces sp. NPDC056716]|uniref:hypothetical protein n=1 Tax=unclassified Streptomyces TaxID=2593676 RepID=UPI0036BAEC86